MGVACVINLAVAVAGLQALSVEISPIVSVGVLAACALLTVVAVTRLIERRNPADIGLGVRRLGMDWLKGAGVGAAYLCASVGILAVLGGYRITGVAFAGQALAGGLVFHVLVGVFEETLFRGMLFRFLEEGFGSWIALTMTALFFGLSHLSNPHATVRCIRVRRSSHPTRWSAAYGPDLRGRHAQTATRPLPA